MLHKLTGKSFDALEREVLFDPPGISDLAWTHFGAPGQEIDWIAGRGFGGQRLIAIPSEDAAMVVLAGHYDGSPLQKNVGVNLLSLVVLPAIFNH